MNQGYDTTSWHLESSFPWLVAFGLIALLVAVSVLHKGRAGRRTLVLSSVLRSLAVLLLLVAASRPVTKAMQPAPLLLSFLYDVSESIVPREREAFLGEVNEIAAQLRPEDECRLIAFGREAREVRRAVGQVRFAVRGYDLDGSRTNLAEALRAAVFGQENRPLHRVVLFSDGNENLEDVESVMPVVRASQTPVFTFAPRGKRPESFHRPYFEKISAPLQVGTDERFYIHVFLTNPTPTHVDASLRLSFDGETISEQRLELPPGLTPFRLAWHDRRTGIHCIKAEISKRPEGREARVPNRSATDAMDAEGREESSAIRFIHVISKPRVLVVDRDEGRRGFLAELLKKDFEIEEGVSLPAEFQELLRYDCIVLDDLPAEELRRGEMDLLARMVQDAGTGLVVIGGDDEHGMSSYRQTRIEDILPVRLDLRTAKDRRDFALVLVIDRSGSMAGEKIEMARRAALKAIENLEPGDVLGIVAFDSQAHWIVPIVTLEENRLPVKRSIKSLGEGGGTNARSAMRAVFEELLRRQMNIRQHVVLISDGLTEGVGFVDLVGRMSEHGITVSTVAIGDAANLSLLKKLESAGKGEFYHITDVSKLPNIVLEDIEESLREVNIIRTEFRPHVHEPHPIIKGLDPSGLPVLKSYSLSVLKPSGHKPLVTTFKNTDDPILATWVYGLGKCSTILSGLRTGWLGEGTAWKQFGPLWSQLVRWTARTYSAEHPLVKLTMEEDRLRLNLRVPMMDQDYPHSISARVVSPGAGPVPFRLEQKSVFEYEGGVTARADAHQALVIEGFRSEGPWVNAYPLYVPEPVSGKELPVESHHEPPNTALLERLARETNGRHEPDFSEIVRRGAPVAVRTEFWPFLAVLAMFVFLADIAVRRLLS